MEQPVIDYLGLTTKDVKLINDILANEPIRILSGDEEYEQVRTERNRNRDEFERTGSRGALGRMKTLDKVLETYERSKK